MQYAIHFIFIQQLLLLALNAEALCGQRVPIAAEGEFPFIASLQHLNGKHFCSGSLITRGHVITTAHCLLNKTPGSIWIAFGLVNVGTTSAATITSRYAVHSWLTYDIWADRQGIAKDPVIHDIAIIKLFYVVKVKPIDLSWLNKQQIQGKSATVLGWSENAIKELQKATVKVLSDEDCREKARLITNTLLDARSTFLCTFADPYVLLKGGDSGGPLIGKDHSLLGINVGDGPNIRHAWGNFTLEFLKKYQVNIHSSVDYYRNFILSALTGF